MVGCRFISETENTAEGFLSHAACRSWQDSEEEDSSNRA
jgi:hypothetical protein